MASRSATRPYRSLRRPRPCDECRNRKLRCQNENGPPCRRCAREGVPCTFQSHPRQQSRRGVQSTSMQRSPSPPASNDPGSPFAPMEHTPLSQPTTSAGHSRYSPVSHAHHSQACSGDATLSIGLEQPSVTAHSSITPQQIPDTRLTTQFSQSIDKIQGHSAQLFGASSESDPWLLRHCQFDEFGMRNFHKTHFRNVGGVPIAQKIPVHFMISTNELYESVRDETRINAENDYDTELNHIVPPEYGPRLIAL